MSGVDETRRERTVVTIPDPSVNVRGLALPLFWSGAALIGAAVALGLSVMESARKVGGSIDALAAQEKRFADFYEPVPDDGGPRPKAIDRHSGLPYPPDPDPAPLPPIRLGDRFEANGFECSLGMEEDGKPCVIIYSGSARNLPPPIPSHIEPEEVPAKPHGPPTPEAVQDFRAAVGDTIANGAGWTWFDTNEFGAGFWVVKFGRDVYHVTPSPAGNIPWGVWKLLNPDAERSKPEELPAPPKTVTPPADSVEELFRDKSA